VVVVGKDAELKGSAMCEEGAKLFDECDFDGEPFILFAGGRLQFW
jgi:hypothetical protein